MSQTPRVYNVREIQPPSQPHTNALLQRKPALSQDSTYAHARNRISHENDCNADGCEASDLIRCTLWVMTDGNGLTAFCEMHLQ